MRSPLFPTQSKTLMSVISNKDCSPPPARFASSLHADCTGFGIGRMPAYVATLNWPWTDSSIFARGSGEQRFLGDLYSAEQDKLSGLSGAPIGEAGEDRGICQRPRGERSYRALAAVGSHHQAWEPHLLRHQFLNDQVAAAGSFLQRIS